MIERECARIRQTFDAITPLPGPVVETLTCLGRAYLDVVVSTDAMALFRVVMAETPRFPALGRQFYLSGPRISLNRVVACLEDLARQGAIDVQAVGVESAASLFLSLVRGEAQLECLTHPEALPSAAQRDQWVRLAVSTFLRAFGVAHSDCV